MYRVLWLTLSVPFLFWAQGTLAQARTLELGIPGQPDDPTRVFLSTLTESALLKKADLTVKTIDLQISGQLFDVVRLVQDGKISMALVPAGVLEAQTPKNALTHASLISQPSVVRNAQEHFAIEDSIFGDVVSAEIGRLRLVVLAFWNREPISVLSKTSIKSFADFKGLKVVSRDASAHHVYAAIGALANKLPPNETVLALQQGAFDAAEAPTSFAAASLFRFARGGTILTDLRQQLGFLLIGETTFLGLNEHQRSAITAAAATARQLTRADIIKGEETLSAAAKRYDVHALKFLSLGGMHFRETTASEWMNVAGERGRSAWNLLEQVRRTVPPTKNDKEGQVSPPHQPKILFVTSREDEEQKDLTNRFGAKRSQNPGLTCGEISFDSAIRRRFGARYEGLLHLQNDRVTRGPENCVAMVSQAAGKFGGRVLIFVHGYWNSFESALRRAIAVGTDLEIRIPIVVWSWPSQNSRSGYFYDEESIEWNRPLFVTFLRLLSRKDRVRAIDILSHSMGGRLGLIALEMSEETQRRLRHIIFVAPDVPTSTFQYRIALYKRMIGSRTLYAAERDRALQMSERLHGEARAGRGGNYIIVMDGVDSIDASEVELEEFEINHSHAFDVPEAAGDLGQLINQNLTADKRNLRPATKNGIRYWFIRRRV